MFLKDNLQTLEMKDGEIVIKHFQSFLFWLEQLSVARAPITDECDHNQMRQEACQLTKKKCNVVTNIFMVPF